MPSSARVGSVTRFGLVGAIVAVLLVVSGCQSRLGLAASVGSTNIDTNELNAFTGRSLDAFASTGQAVPAGKQGDLERNVLGLLVREALVDQVAAKEGITTTAAQVRSERASAVAQAGGEQAFENQLKQQGISPQDIDMIVRENVLIGKLQTKLNTTDSSTFTKDLANLAKAIKIRVNPRFGKWDPSTLTISGQTNDLSTTVTRS